MVYQVREDSIHGGAPFELYLFQTADETFALTSKDEEVDFGGNIYAPTPIQRTEIGQDSELRGGSITVTVPKNEPVALQFVAFLPTTPLNLVVFRRHEGDPDIETVVHFTGRVVKATFGDACEFECMPDTDLLKRRIPGPQYQRPCNRMLYATGCDVDRNLFKVSGTITDITLNGFRIRAAAFATQPDGFFDSGYIELGVIRTMILRHIFEEFDLITPMPGLQIDDVVTAFAGCQRTYSDCQVKFANETRFMGFEFIPSKNPFKGLE